MSGENLNNSIINKLFEVVEFFEKAEDAIKSAELAERDLALTPVNQLRYGFKHLTQAIRFYKNCELEKFDTDINKAIGHCKRSYFDAKDVEITYHLDRYQEFIKVAQDRGVIISSVLPNYSNWVSSTTKVQNFLVNASALYPDKDERYREIDQYLVIMRKISEDLPGAIELINENLDVQRRLQEDSSRSRQEAAEAKQLARDSLWYTKIATAVGVFAIIAAVLVVIFDGDLKSIRNKFMQEHKAPTSASQ